jgi:hypothetical protein
MEQDDSKRRESVLLVEYQKAQDSAQFHDGLVWTSTGITWALSLVLMGFTLNNLRSQIPVTAFSIIGILLICFQWEVQRIFRSVKKQKYERCKEIEGPFDMRNHSMLVYESGGQTFLYRLVCASMIAGWLAVLYASWISSR